MGLSAWAESAGFLGLPSRNHNAVLFSKYNQLPVNGEPQDGFRAARMAGSGDGPNQLTKR
jgi:hypothetical protein